MTPRSNWMICQPARQNLRLLLSTPPLAKLQALMKSQPTFWNVTTACCHICTTSFVLVSVGKNFQQRWKLTKLWLCWRRETRVTAITIVEFHCSVWPARSLLECYYQESKTLQTASTQNYNVVFAGHVQQRIWYFFHCVKANRNAENKLKKTSPHSLCGPQNTFLHGGQGEPMCYPSETGMPTNIA